MLLLVVLALLGNAHGIGTDFFLRSMAYSSCNTSRALAVVKIALGTCLNNHDFSGVACNVFQRCLGNNTVRYEDLVTCTGAPPMPLSISASYDEGDEVTVHVYPISKTCFGIPLPLSYKRYECVSSRFALNPSCGHRGAEMDWPDWRRHNKKATKSV